MSIKKCLLIDSSPERFSLWIDFLKILKERDFNFILLLADSQEEEYKGIGNRANKIFFSPEIEKRAGLFLFIALLPVLLVIHFFALIYLRFKFHFDSVICLNWNEKIIYGFLARILKLRLVWVERPGVKYRRLPKLLRRLYKINSQNARIIAFTSQAKMQLEGLGVDKDNINLVLPGVKLHGSAKHQETIFTSIAQQEKSNYRRKYFTIGLVTDFKEISQIEILFQAVIICLNIIPNLQIIIVGEGESKKKVSWAAKKMGLESLTWLVGRQENLQKWLEGFDIYYLASTNSNPQDIKLALKAMAAGLPVIGFKESGFDDIVVENQSGFLGEPGDSEALAGRIISLQQDKRLRKKISENASRIVQDQFNIEKKSEEIIKIITKD